MMMMTSKWTSSSESILSVVGSSSSPFKPICLNQLPSCLLRLVVSHCQVVQAMIGHVVNLPLTCLPPLKKEGMAHKELVAHPNALLNDL
jgi:hypothetical protein